MHGHSFDPPTLSAWAIAARQDPMPTYIVEPFLPADNLILISGHPKDSKKTWLAMRLALDAALSGSNVAFCYREGSRQATLQRFEALTHGDQELREYMYQHIWFAHRGVFFLDDTEQVKNACKFIKRYKIDLFFIDTFAKSMQGDENSSKDAGRAITATERMRDAGASVVLVHHLRKAHASLSYGTFGNPEPDKDLRGSSALAGAYETHIAIRSYGGEPSILLIGGKEMEWRAYSYNWSFANNFNGLLQSANLDMKEIVMPYIESTGR